MLELIQNILIILMLVVLVEWTVLTLFVYNNYKKAPLLTDFELVDKQSPKVSIIVPARNEEENLSKCLDTLINLDYENYEIIVVNDNSTDSTEEIIKNYANNNPIIIPINAPPKPDEWTGKCWAVMEGYKRAEGELLLHTDADTQHSKESLSLAVSHLLSFNLDALNVITEILSDDKFTKPVMISLYPFALTMMSPLLTNNPKKKTSHFAGAYILIRKNVYDKVGGHEQVRTHLLEDVQLARILKSSGYKIKVVRGESFVSAYVAKKTADMWNFLKRTFKHEYKENPMMGILYPFIGFLYFTFPIIMFIFSLLSLIFSNYFSLLTILSILTLIAMSICWILQAKGLSFNIRNVLLAPIGCIISFLGITAGILDSSISWRGRSYSDLEKFED
jgi:glycosyltransferase involved in cell wall biosynthesis